MASASSLAAMRNPSLVEPSENLWKLEDVSLSLGTHPLDVTPLNTETWVKKFNVVFFHTSRVVFCFLASRNIVSMYEYDYR